MQKYGITKMSKITAGKRKLPEGKRQKVTLTIDPVVWAEFQALAKKMGLSAARLVEISARAQVASQSQAVANVFKGMMKDFTEADDSLTIEQKMKMKDLIESE